MKDPYNQSVTATEGKKSNPAASTLLADSGALSEASEENRHVLLEIAAWMETAGAAGATFIIEHRNAADDGNVRTMEINFAAGDNVIIPYIASYANSERVRVIQGGVSPGAGIDVQVLITGKTVVS